ncbi:cytochrome P460 family protein [Kordiimonas aquimaris]|uniref:cytochrome P460 family protein n=1 Tax=Kordiimonas aquimaris TaxID=707591 RepID=UPI0021CF2725|nr:cytochrome P460 family protein [Kordiimonas aquimaris]
MNKTEDMTTFQKLALNGLMFILAAVVFTVTFGDKVLSESNKSFAGEAVSAEGHIRVPENFRTDYVLMGSWSVAGDADTGGEIGLHIVYAPKNAVTAYRETGAFPDETVIVKELFTGETEFLTTGEATRAKDLVGYFVMVKDDKNRFPDNPLWGEGWGWSFFEGKTPNKTISTDYKSDCLACHEPARETDFIYTNAYPVLKK